MIFGEMSFGTLFQFSTIVLMVLVKLFMSSVDQSCKKFPSSLRSCLLRHN